MEWSKPALDLENSRIYTADQSFNYVAALDFDSEHGFSLAWIERQESMPSFPALVGGPKDRQLIGNDFSPKDGDRAIWRRGQRSGNRPQSNPRSHAQWLDSHAGL